VVAPGPVRQQCRLAEAGRGTDQGQLVRHPVGEQVQQARAREERGSWARDVQLGGQQDVPRLARSIERGRSRLDHPAIRIAR
jgi:hypothetical protein